MICMHSMQPSTKRNETKRPSLFLSPSLPPSLPLHHSLAIFTGEGGALVAACPSSPSRYHFSLFVYLVLFIYRTCIIQYCTLFLSLPPSITCHLGRISYQLPGPKLTHVSIHPSIHTDILFNSFPRSLARLRRRRGDHMVFFSFFYIYLFTLSHSHVCDVVRGGGVMMFHMGTVR